MNELLIQGEPLVLESDGSISLQLNTPLIQEGEILGDRTYAFKLPFCPTNDKILSHARHLRISNRKTLFYAEHRFAGTYMSKGDLIIEEVNDGYTCNYIIGGLASELNGKSLKDVDYGADIVLGASSSDVSQHCMSDHKAEGYTFPMIYNAQFYGSKVPGFQGFINYKRLLFGAIVNQVRDESGENDNRYTWLPGFYIHWILQRVADDIGWSFEGEFFDEPYLDDLVLMSETPLDELTNEYYLGHAESTSTLTHSGLQGLNPQTKTGYISELLGIAKYTTQAKGMHKVVVQISYRVYKTGVPSSTGRATLRINYNGNIIHQTQFNPPWNTTVEDSLEYEFYAAGNLPIHVEMHFEYEQAVDDWVDATGDWNLLTFDVTNEQNARINHFKKNLVFQDHMLDRPVGDLLKALASSFHLLIKPDYEKKVVRFDFAEYMVAAPADEDWTDRLLVDPNNPRQLNFQTNRNRGVRLKWDEDLMYESVLSGRPEKDIKLELSPWPIGDKNGDVFLANNSANSEAFESTGRNLFRMVWPDPENRPPLELSLVHGAANIYTQFLASSNKFFWAAEEVDANLNLTLIDLKNLKFSRAKIILGQRLYLKQVRAELKDGVRVSNCKFLKLLVKFIVGFKK